MTPAAMAGAARGLVRGVGPTSTPISIPPRAARGNHHCVKQEQREYAQPRGRYCFSNVASLLPGLLRGWKSLKFRRRQSRNGVPRPPPQVPLVFRSPRTARMKDQPRATCRPNDSPRMTSRGRSRRAPTRAPPAGSAPRY